MNLFTPRELADRIQKAKVESPEATEAMRQLISSFVDLYATLLVTVAVNEGHDAACNQALMANACLVGAFKDTANNLDADAHDLFVALDAAVQLLPEPDHNVH